MAIAKITTLTPIHVGSGTTYNRNIDFVQESGRIGIVDANKVAALLSGDTGNISSQDIKDWVAEIESDKPDTLKFLREGRGKKLLIIDDISERVFPTLEEAAHVNTLKGQIRTTNEGAYLPGSSLKGAIRTAVINRLILTNPAHARDISLYKEVNQFKDKKTGEEKTKIKYKGGALERRYAGPDANHDIMRLLRIGDAHFGETACLLAKTLNEKGNGHEIKHEVTQFVECINQGESALCQIGIPDDLLRQINQQRFSEVARKMSNRTEVATWQTVFQRVNSHTLKHLNHEISRYESLNLPNEATDFVDKLKEIRALFAELSANECIIRVGFGVGYLSMTGGWVFEQWKDQPSIDYNKEIEHLSKEVRHKAGYKNMTLPKSRKLSLNGTPLGFVRISILNNSEEANACRQNIIQRAELKEQQRIEAERSERKRLENLHKPKTFEGKLKVGAELDAEIVVSGKPNKLKIHVDGHENDQIPMIGYAAAEPVGKVVLVTVNILGKDGKVKEVRYKKFK